MRGSPTVSPTTAALCTWDPFFWTIPSIESLPPSINFLALSQAPPELENDIASYIPEAIVPDNNPLTPLAPNKKPITIGDSTTSNPGIIIYSIDDFVDISIHL